MLVTKSEFAALMNRSPGAVSQWIASGKLSGAALVGQGRDQRINIEEAQRQLSVKLDLGQQLAQPQPVLMAQPPAVPAEPADDDQSKLLRAKREREEIALRKERADELAREGRWLDADTAENRWSAELAAWVRAIEQWLATGAAETVAALAADGKVAVRDMAGGLKASFRDLRVRMAQEAAEAATRAPNVDDDDDDSDDEGGAAE